MSADALLKFLHDYEEVASRVAQQLSRNYYSAYEEIRTLGLSNSPAQRFAKLLLGWSTERGDPIHALNLHLVLTHEEIAEMIGTTRETVSRLFSDFRMKHLIQSKGFQSGDPRQVGAGRNGSSLNGPTVAAWQAFIHPKGSHLTAAMFRK